MAAMMASFPNWQPIENKNRRFFLASFWRTKPYSFHSEPLTNVE